MSHESKEGRAPTALDLGRWMLGFEHSLFSDLCLSVSIRGCRPALHNYCARPGARGTSNDKPTERTTYNDKTG